MAIVGLAESMYEYLQPAHGDRIVLPPVQAEMLRNLLSKLGIDPRRVRSETDQEGLEVIRILRHGAVPDNGDEDGSDAAPAADRYLGVALKRILLVILAASRCR